MPKVHISAFCGLSRCHYSNSPRSRTQYTEAFASKSWTRSSVSEKCFFQSMESQRVKSWKHAAGKVIRDIRDIPYLLRRHSIWLWIINIWCIMIMVYSGYIYIYIYSKWYSLPFTHLYTMNPVRINGWSPDWGDVLRLGNPRNSEMQMSQYVSRIWGPGNKNIQYIYKYIIDKPKEYPQQRETKTVAKHAMNEACLLPRPFYSRGRACKLQSRHKHCMKKTFFQKRLRYCGPHARSSCKGFSSQRTAVRLTLHFIYLTYIIHIFFVLYITYIFYTIF